MSGARAVFVDRDGVINELAADPATGAPESPLHPGDVRLLDGAAEALARLRDAGWMLVGVSNQPAAAKGTITLDELLAVQDRVLELVAAAAGVRFDGFELCLHHPQGVLAELSGPCDCRKPEPGMLRAAASRLGIDLSASWMVGDTDADVEAGHAAGCATILIEHPGSVHKRAGRGAASAAVADLAGAADKILHGKS